MIRFQPITTSDVQHYKFMEELLVESFPPEEYRELEHLREYTDRIGNFHNNIIFDDDLPIGFITYWDFDGFYYVEHFATNPALRNGGYGKRTLEHLCEFLKRPIVLEVERPVEEMAKRRINFTNGTDLHCGKKTITSRRIKKETISCLCISWYTATWMQKRIMKA